MSDESDFCCGNGCVNCVLNEKPKHKINLDSCGKRNIFDKFTKFKLKSKIKYENLNDVYILHFVSTAVGIGSADCILNIPSGNHVMMKIPLNVTENESMKKLLRPYSPFWTDCSELEFKILVNLQPGGPMSNYISLLKDNDEVEFRGPIGGDYEHKATMEENNRLVIISQGVAIAPTLPIIKEILDNEDDMTRVYHFACFKNLERFYFRKKLAEFTKYWNYDNRIYLARQQCGREECLKNGFCEENCPLLLKKLMYKEKVFTRRLNGDELYEVCNSQCGIETKFVVCGSRGFQDHIENVLKNLDLQADNNNIFLL